MILHLVEDDSFSSYAIKQFTNCSLKNSEFLIVIPKEDYEFKFIKEFENVTVIVYNSNDFKQLAQRLSAYKAIISHNLFPEWKSEIIRSAPDFVKIGWVFWGGELYNRRGYTINFLGSHTKRYYTKYLYKQKLKRLLNKILFRKEYTFSYEVPKEVFRKIKYCLTDNFIEVADAKIYFGANFEPLWYNYYSIQETLGSLLNSRSTGHNILLGNSAAITNNHLEAIKFLSTITLQEREVIVPLSYGDSYATPIVKKYGYQMLNRNFVPIDTYLDREEYNKIIKSCSVAVFNSYRPQAVGNIITSVWLGIRVYLSKKSVLYDYFKGIGIVLFSIEEHLNSENHQVLDKLPIKDVQHNRMVLMAVYGKDEMSSKIQQVISILNE